MAEVSVGHVTVGEFLDRWLEDSVKHSVKLIAYENYSVLTRRHLIPTLERHKLEDLAPGHIRKFRSNKLNKSRAIDENRSAPTRPLA